MGQLQLSVIVPVYNGAKTIAVCLESLLSQSIKAEIIVVDDGSNDGTANLVKKYPVKLLQQEHRGPGMARNLGAAQAKGEILVLVDSDMRFDQNFLKDLTVPLEAGSAKGSWSGDELVANWDNLWARCWNYNQGRLTAGMIGSHGQRRVFRAILTSEFCRVGGFAATGYTDDWSLVDKLKYQPAATQAKFYHYNPDSLLAVFTKAKWIGKRQYKLGKLGTLLTIIKANAGFSLLVGLFQAVKFRTGGMIPFRLVYDLGILSGALANLCFGSSY